MMTAKKGIVAATVLATIGTGSVGIISAFAAENPNSRATGMENLTQALVDKFGINAEEVRTVFYEQHAEIQADREEHKAERLERAVANDVLTQEQADAISAHRDEMQTLIKSLENATPEERKETLNAQHETNKIWAKENNIPKQFLPHEGHHNKHRHHPFNGTK